MLSRSIKSLSKITSLRAQNSLRFSSNIITEIHPENDEVAVLKLNAPPVNALSRPFLADLQKSIQDLEKNKDIRAMILTSSNNKIFSAGLDIKEMWRREESEVREFWKQLQDTWLTLYSTRLLTVAGINGTSPAGGCLLAISCDHRVMAQHPKFNIGLNETKLGLVAPKWFAMPFEDLVGKRKAEAYLYKGHLLPVPEALQVGLIDEAVEADQVMEAALEAAESYLNVPDFARAGTKQQITRKDNIDWMKKNRGMDLEVFVATVMDEKVQGALDMYMAMLGAAKK